MTAAARPPGVLPRLYHTPSSYYSMIARLALAEGGVAHERVFVDIHVRLGQQQPDYVRLNPGMTAPTLVLADRVLVQSRDIAAYALGVGEVSLDAETRAWLDLHYDYPIEELTFGGILARNPPGADHDSEAARSHAPPASGARGRESRPRACLRSACRSL